MSDETLTKFMMAESDIMNGMETLLLLALLVGLRGWQVARVRHR